MPVSRFERLDRQLRELAAEADAETGATASGAVDQAGGGFAGRRGGGGKREREVPLARLRSVTVAGRGVTISSDLIEALTQRGIGLAFLSSRGTPVAHLSAPGLTATVETRRAQLAAYDTPRGLELAAAFVAGKLRNQRHTLLYFSKYLKEAAPARFDRVRKKAAILSKVRRQVMAWSAARGPLSVESGDVASTTDHGPRTTRQREQLMGMEGTGARVYWEGVAAIVEGKVAFPGRETRGALDPVNAALNYGYGILYSQVEGAVINAGLEPFAGFLHVDRPGKPSLVLDLVEEFRAPVVDRPILALVNQGIKLETDPHGLTAATRRLVADRVLERLEKPVPFEGKRHRLRIILQMQARHVATAVRGERTYRPFSSRW